MNIKKELNSIINLYSKGAEASFVNNLNSRERELALKIEKPLENITLTSLRLLENDTNILILLNKSNIDVEDFNELCLLKNKFNISEIMEDFDKDLFEEIVEKNNSRYDYEFNFNCYYKIKRKYIKTTDLSGIMDVYESLKCNISKLKSSYYYISDKNSQKRNDIYTLFLTNTEKLYCQLVSDIVLKLNYSKKEVMDFYSLLYNDNTFDYETLNYVNKIFLNSRDKKLQILFFFTLTETLSKASFDEKIELKTIIDKLSSNQTSCKWLNYLCNGNVTSFDINDLRKLYKVDIDEKTSENPIEILYNQPVLTTLFNIRDTSCLKKARFVKNNLKKKGFMRLLNENQDILMSLPMESVLFDETFGKIVNLNTLNINNLNTLKSMISNADLSEFLDSNIPLTFLEFEALYNTYKKGYINPSIYYNLLDLKIDQRLKLIRQLPSITLKDVKNNWIIDYNEKSLSIAISQLIREKSFRDRINSLDLNIERINDYQYLLLFLFEEKIKKFAKDIKYGVDIEFLLSNYDAVIKKGSIIETKREFYSADKDYQKLITCLYLNDEFINRNLERIVNFCDKKLHKVFVTLFYNNEINQNQKNNLILLVKAELVGKLKEIKFDDDDFDLEIGLQIPQDAKNEWKQNIVKKSNFLYEETYDFETIIRLGQYPVNTCQHWDYGMYVKCLLSNFDTNKKMLTSSKDGVLNARSLIRLTKGTFDRTKTSLSFKDVENLENEIPIKQNEELVLFLEKLYTNLDSKDELVVRREFVKIAEEKANRLGAKLVVSNDYYDILNDSNFEEKEYYMFISYSKNGYQYLDSLTGSCSSRNEGEFIRSYFYMKK